MNLFADLYTNSFMPHGHCFLWDPLVLWLNVISDTFIACAYFSIPVALFQVFRRRKDLAFNWMFFLFAVFIFACGTTHLLEVWNVWHSNYLVAGFVKFATACASVVTAILLWPLIPKILRIPSLRQLEQVNNKLQQEIKEKTKAEAQILALNTNLEYKVSEATREFRELANSMPQIVWAARADGYVDYFNQRWYDFTHFAKSEGGDASWLPILHPDDEERTLETWYSCVRNGAPFEIEYRFKDRAAHTYKWFLGRALPIKDEAGRVVRWYGTCTDIDSKKKLEDEHTKSLAQERVVRSTLEQTSRIKDEFLATLSHELRTPLNAVLGWVQLMRSGKMQPEKVTQALETIERNARAQAQIIDDLLDMNRIVSGKVRLDVQQVDLSKVIDAAIDGVSPAAVAKDIHIEKVIDSLPLLMQGDPSRLQQIIWNLVSNAIKFTDRGGRIQVTLDSTDSHVELSVTDNGSGIAPQFLPYVFEKFTQADSSSTRRYGGLGLGLSLVKQLVELHGGSVRAKSAGEGQGATFIVILPVSTSSLPTSNAEKSEEEALPLLKSEVEADALHGLAILVVDDQIDARELITAALEEYKAHVIAADSADAALGIILRQRPDVIISDIGMPNKDGYQFIRELRSHPPELGGTIPAIALTAFARSEDRINAFQAGFQMHIAKPVDAGELIAIVASLVKRKVRG